MQLFLLTCCPVFFADEQRLRAKAKVAKELRLQHEADELQSAPGGLGTRIDNASKKSTVRLACIWVHRTHGILCDLSRSAVFGNKMVTLKQTGGLLETEW